MSASQRIIPLIAVSFIGVATGIYVFDPLLRQYAHETKGTFKPEDISVTPATPAGNAKASTSDKDKPTIADAASSAVKGIVGSDTTKRAEDLRNKAALNAATRAKDAALDRAEKTGDGKIL